jgi:hypothetical protein
MRQIVLAFTLTGLMGFTGCGSSQSSSNDEESSPDSSCTEPQNPYSEGSGHYAGYVNSNDRHPSLPSTSLP